MPMGSIFPNKKFRTNYIKGRGLQLFLARGRGGGIHYFQLGGGGANDIFSKIEISRSWLVQLPLHGPLYTTP